MRVTVDDERCHGHQMCAIAAPAVFGSDDYGNAVVLIPGELPTELEAAARRAEGNCPERAITIEERDRGVT
jgi:ferredoxin